MANAGYTHALALHLFYKVIWVQLAVTGILEVPGSIINGPAKARPDGQQA